MCADAHTHTYLCLSVSPSPCAHTHSKAISKHADIAVLGFYRLQFCATSTAYSTAHLPFSSDIGMPPFPLISPFPMLP
eukprot:17855_6